MSSIIYSRFRTSMRELLSEAILHSLQGGRRAGRGGRGRGRGRGRGASYQARRPNGR